MKITLTHNELVLLQEVSRKQVDVETKTVKQEEYKKLEEAGLVFETVYPGTGVNAGKYMHRYSISGLGSSVLKEHLPYRTDNRDAKFHAS